MAEEASLELELDALQLGSVDVADEHASEKELEMLLQDLDNELLGSDDSSDEAFADELDDGQETEVQVEQVDGPETPKQVQEHPQDAENKNSTIQLAHDEQQVLQGSRKSEVMSEESHAHEDDKACAPPKNKEQQQQLQPEQRPVAVSTHTPAQYVHVVVPPGPLGVNMSERQGVAGVVITSILALPNGQSSPLAGKVPLHSLLMRVNDVDVHQWGLQQLVTHLHKLANSSPDSSKTLVFRLPPNSSGRKVAKTLTQVQLEDEDPFGLGSDVAAHTKEHLPKAPDTKVQLTDGEKEQVVQQQRQQLRVLTRAVRAGTEYSVNFHRGPIGFTVRAFRHEHHQQSPDGDRNESNESNITKQLRFWIGAQVHSVSHPLSQKLQLQQRDAGQARIIAHRLAAQSHLPTTQINEGDIVVAIQGQIVLGWTVRQVATMLVHCRQELLAGRPFSVRFVRTFRLGAAEIEPRLTDQQREVQLNDTYRLLWVYEHTGLLLNDLKLPAAEAKSDARNSGPTSIETVDSDKHVPEKNDSADVLDSSLHFGAIECAHTFIGLNHISSPNSHIQSSGHTSNRSFRCGPDIKGSVLHSGDQLNGVAMLVLPKLIPILAVKIVIVGEEYTYLGMTTKTEVMPTEQFAPSQSQRKHQRREHHTETRIICRHEIIVWQWRPAPKSKSSCTDTDHESPHLQAGTYSLPFGWTLPLHLPRSYEEEDDGKSITPTKTHDGWSMEQCFVRYSIQLKLVPALPNPQFQARLKDLETWIPMTVLECCPSCLLQYHPVQATKSKTFLFGGSLPCVASVHLPNSVLVVGKQVPVDMSISNATDRSVAGFHVRLVRYTQLRAGNRIIQKESDAASQRYMGGAEEVRPHSERHFSFVLSIPENIRGSVTSACLITVRHELVVDIKSLGSFSLSVQVPVYVVDSLVL